MYLGDLERLQDIQRKRDVTNRNWQRIVLRNIGNSLGWEMDSSPSCSPPEGTKISSAGPRAVATRELWWKVYSKMKEKSDYSNMLLLAKMESTLEELMHNRRQRFITAAAYENMIRKIHLDTEGSVVEPFVALTEQSERKERHRLWNESLAIEAEEKCLVK